MAVTLRGREERNKRAQEIARLSHLANQHKAEAGVFLQNPGWVFNPDPAHLVPRWSDPEKIARRKAQGWRVIPADEANAKWQVPAAECDKAKNCAIRNGQILMVTTIENAAGIQAGYILEAERRISSDTDELAKAMGS